MYSETKKAGLFMKGLTVAMLAIPLVLVPLGGAACAVPCLPEGPGVVRHCTLDASTPVLPDFPIPSCCVSELLQGEQYVSSRQKSDKRRTPPLRNVAVPISSVMSAPLILGPSHSGSRLLSTQPGSNPLYMLHAVFLI